MRGSSVNPHPVSSLWGFVLACSLLLAGCTPVPPPARVQIAPDETLLISPAVYDDYLAYLGKLNILNAGAYVVSDTGVGAGFVICDSKLPWQCYGNDYYVERALRMCEREGSKCVVFAEGAKILVDYEISE